MLGFLYLQRFFESGLTAGGVKMTASIATHAINKVEKKSGFV